MPTLHRYRVWCKKCDNFTLHTRDEFKTPVNPEDNKLVCKTCNTVYSDIMLKDIPRDKLLEQRKRYSESQGNMFNSYLNLGSLFKTPEQRQLEEMVHMFSPPGSDIEIHESDAGQKEIDKIEGEKRKKEWEERKRIREAQEAEAAKYAKLGRNDICACGSGIKYKKCCLRKIESYGT